MALATHAHGTCPNAHMPHGAYATWHMRILCHIRTWNMMPHEQAHATCTYTHASTHARICHVRNLAHHDTRARAHIWHTHMRTYMRTHQHGTHHGTTWHMRTSCLCRMMPHTHRWHIHVQMRTCHLHMPHAHTQTTHTTHAHGTCYTRIHGTCHLHTKVTARPLLR
jgi:hypothetical protein